MKTYQVVSHQGIGPIQLGMSRAESRAAMNLPFTSSKRHPTSPEVDFYYENSFQVFFDENDKVEYIELSKSDSFKAIYRGVNTHTTEAKRLIAHLLQDARFDESHWELGYSYIFPALELSVWRATLPADEADEEGRYFATIGVGKRGYYSG